MKDSFVRILIADDFDPWLGFVVQLLRQRPHVRIVGFASDGLETVQKAGEFQPDLILLDISLPKLNGIEAARQIRKVAPKTKILFLSSNADPDVVRAAFLAGGRGYVLKSDAEEALLPGMEAVRLGKLFVTSNLIEINDLSDTEK